MFDYGHFRFESKQALFDKAVTFWNPDKTKFWQKAGVCVKVVTFVPPPPPVAGLTGTAMVTHCWLLEAVKNEFQHCISW